MELKVAFLVTTCLTVGVYGALRMPNYYSDHMVLQRAPARAILWGYADIIGDTVTVLMNGLRIQETTVQNSSSHVGAWKLKLPAESNAGPHEIQVQSSEGNFSFSDVMFGDVWVCSGQSNMQFKMNMVHNREYEIDKSIQYTSIRMILSNHVNSSYPLDDVSIKHPWIYPVKGETHSEHPDLYACQFPAMINDWREKFHAASDGETSDHFPFGFVQLAPWRAPWRASNQVSRFPQTRWAQTTDVGYVPNSNMPDTFMAVAIDLPDFDSPYSGYKQDIAARLVLGARNVPYGERNVIFQGPFPTSYSVDKGQHSLIITFDNGTGIVHRNNNNGFEVCCASTTSGCNNPESWIAAPIKGIDTSKVQIDASVCYGNYHVAGVRYLWEESPCALKQCALYGSQTHLPVPPFMKIEIFKSTKSVVVS